MAPDDRDEVLEAHAPVPHPLKDFNHVVIRNHKRPSIQLKHQVQDLVRSSVICIKENV